jgi:hypothetical protein
VRGGSEEAMRCLHWCLPAQAGRRKVHVLTVVRGEQFQVALDGTYGGNANKKQ